MKDITLAKLTDLFWVVSPNLFFLSFILNLTTGFLYSLLIPFVMYAISSDTMVEMSPIPRQFNFFESPTSQMASVFLLVCISIIAMRTFSMTVSMYLSGKASSLHRLTLYKKIHSLSILQLEKIGHSNLINLIHVDVSRTTNAAMTIPIVFSACITILGTLAYLIYLDIRIFTFVLLALIFSVMTYQLPSFFSMRYFKRYRTACDDAQKGFMDLVMGAKELKLNDRMAQSFFDEAIVRPENEIITTHLKGNFLFVLAENYGSLISFLVIAVVVFHLPYIYDLQPAELFGIVMVLLYLTGPVGLILSAMGEIKLGKISLANIKKYYPLLDAEKNIKADEPLNPNWDVIKVKHLSFNYSAEHFNFSISDICFEILPGEIVFITGSNGSGKSTLSKCLSLHYTPTSGGIYFGDQLLTEKNLKAARGSISAIYADFYLFDKIYSCNITEKRETIDHYLNLLELKGKVSIEDDGTFSTTKLSSGQRKRLALLVLLLEDREICIFDEWAADQDPYFKKVFYHDVLQYLKRKNKFIIVISHDDRHFGSADKMLVLDNGKLKEVINCNLEKV